MSSPKHDTYSRREYIKLSGLGVVGLATASSLGAKTGPPKKATFDDPIPTPETADFNWKNYHFNITQQKGELGLINTNGKNIGPEIRLKRGDVFRGTVNNGLETPTTLHWHGMIVPCYVDGVPDVTQMAIPPSRSFVYEYPIVQTGTYWYHSHYRLQEQQGLAGPLIIEDDVQPYPYDQDNTMFFEDRVDADPEEVFKALKGKSQSEKAKAVITKPKGKLNTLPDGTEFDLDVYPSSFVLNGVESKGSEPFTVEAESGKPLRMRFINGSASSFIRIQVGDLPMTIIEKDGNPVMPVKADNMVLGTAERYDVLVTPKTKGAIRVTIAVLGVANGMDSWILVDGAKLPETQGQTWQTPTWGKKVLTYADLVSKQVTTLPEGPVREFDLALGGNMKTYQWSIGGQYYPEAAPLLIKEGERVKIRIINNTGMYHPMHLHGHFYRLLGLNNDSTRAPLMDTVKVAPKETIEIEFTADNPGAWIFHCHNLYHLMAGMARVFHYEP